MPSALVPPGEDAAPGSRARTMASALAAAASGASRAEPRTNTSRAPSAAAASAIARAMATVSPTGRRCGRVGPVELMVGDRRHPAQQ
jgi:hypothetical protein